MNVDNLSREELIQELYKLTACLNEAKEALIFALSCVKSEYSVIWEKDVTKALASIARAREPAHENCDGAPDGRHTDGCKP